jgi:hypothetical protein
MLLKAIQGFCYVVFLGLLTIYVCEVRATQSAGVFVYTEQQQDINLFQVGTLLAASYEGFPDNSTQIATWLDNKKPQTSTTYYGGSYWLVVELENQTQLAELVLFPYNTLVSRIETRVYDMADPTSED